MAWEGEGDAQEEFGALEFEEAANGPGEVGLGGPEAVEGFGVADLVADDEAHVFGSEGIGDEPTRAA